MLYLVDSIKTAYSHVAGRVTVIVACESVRADTNDAAAIGMCINEIITNSFTYAFPDERMSEIGVSLIRDDGGIALKVWDDGIGLPQGVDTGETNGLGTTLIFGIVKQLNGEISVDGTDGLRYTMRIPISVE